MSPAPATSSTPPRGLTAAALALALVALGQVVLVAAGLPWVRSIPAWFYVASQRGLGAGWAMAALCLLVPWLVRLTLRAAERGQRARVYASVFTLGLVTQALFVPLDAKRTESLLTRHEGGHAEFHVIAQERRDSALATLRSYDELAESQQLGAFPPSKPPGALALYMGLEALGRGPLAGRLTPLRELAQRSPRVATIEDGFVASTLLFPLFTALLMPLVVALGVRLSSQGAGEDATVGLRVGGAAAALTATSPALLLITFHLDGAWYPLVAVATLLLVTTAMRVSSRHGQTALSARVLALATLAGAVLASGLYVSFSLIPVLGLVLGVVLACALASPHRARPLRRSLLVLIGFALGALGVTALLVATLDFHPLHRFDAAMAYHERWKGAVPVGPWRAAALLEWSLYAGFPLVALLLWRVASSLTRHRDARRYAGALLPLGVVALLVALSVVSGTNEVARMWLFMVPVVAVAVAARPTDSRLYSVLATLQLLVALVMKANQTW